MVLYFRMYRWRIEVNKKQQAVCNKAVLPCFKHHDLYFTFGTLYPHFAVCYNVCGVAVSGLWTEYLQSSVYLLCADDVFFFLVLSWMTAPLSAFSKDFENLINSVITGLFWLSGIFWNTYDISPLWLKAHVFQPYKLFCKRL